MFFIVPHSIHETGDYMVYKILLVGSGGFLGAVSRYLSVFFITEYSGVRTFPLGTLAVNMAGCLVIGFSFGLAEAKQIMSPEVRLLFLTGFLGSFTTYSTFGLESFHLFKTGNPTGAMLNVLIHVIVGLAAVFAGDLISRIF